MTDSRASSVTVTLVPLLVLALALAASPAAGQDASGEDVGEPMRLGPVESAPLEEPSAEAPESGAAEAPAAETAGGDEEPAAEESASGIEVDTLERLDPDSIGTLDPGKGGFGADLWEGSERRVIESLIPRVPADLASPTLRDLAHKLLLSSAAPPARHSVASNGAPGNLLSLRVERLAALGDVDGLNGLLRVVPDRFQDVGMTRLRVQGLLLAHEPAAACNQVRNVIGEHNDKAFWQKALAVCQFRAGQPQAAMLTVGLLREEAGDDHAPFLTLADAAGENVSPPDPIRPLHLALLHATGRSLPAAAVERAGAGVLAAVSRSPYAPLAVRARAAERAAALGVIDTGRLGRLYAAFEFDPKQLDEAPSVVQASGTLTGAARRALLYQAVRRERLTAPRAELVRLALEEARAAGVYRPMAEVLAAPIAEMEPAPELAWFAEIAGRALYAAGRPQAAGTWHRLAREEAIVNPDAAVAVTALWPYSRLAGAPALTPDGGLAAWRSAQGEDGSAMLQHRQSVLRACFQALGEPEPLGWIDIALAGDGHAQPAAPAPLIYAMEAAADAGRRGETVLLALIVLGRHGLGETHPLVLSEALSALADVELEPEARALAIEAALANGI